MALSIKVAFYLLICIKTSLPLEPTKTTCQLAWLPPENDGGCPILNYVVEKREVDRKTWTNCTSDLKKTSFKVTNLMPGIEYYFRVMAVNKYGIGLPQDSPKSYLATDPKSKSTLHSIVYYII